MASLQRIEFGDFQTPASLARRACSVVRDRGVAPHIIIEPTCGVGNFLLAAAEQFTACPRAIGLEVNAVHYGEVRRRVAAAGLEERVQNINGDFFTFDWSGLRAEFAGPPLIIGNPPWVTVAGLGSIDGTNAPPRQNIDRLSGLDAKTGKSNFDIAEAIILNLLRVFEGSGGTVALLVKTSVARRVLAHVWRSNRAIGDPSLYLIDAKASFGVNVDAGLFVFDLPARPTDSVCRVATLDTPDRFVSSIGWRDGTLVSDTDAHDATADFVARGKPHVSLRWRSGIKHDCSSVFELTRVGSRFINGLGATVEVEPHVLYPMCKGSDVANGVSPRRDLWSLVPQTSTGQDTSILARTAPLAWRYLDANRLALDARRSSIYRGRPAFSIFGVGPYTFQNWKVATCGLYKKLRFKLIGPHEDRPVVFDDTVYLLSFNTRELAERVLRCLESDLAMRFFAARTFADAKRPVTASLLNDLDLILVANQIGIEVNQMTIAADRQHSSPFEPQTSLFTDGLTTADNF